MLVRLSLFGAVLVHLLTACTPTLESRGIKVVRFEQNPIIRSKMLRESDGENINGPSLIRVPEWLERRLGRYYLYFAHHNGKYIRLAYADELGGPWTVHNPGTLKLEETICRNYTRTWRRHVASPDVHVDNDSQEIRMYFHCPVEGAETRQVTLVATSKDGVNFTASAEPLGRSYFRVFKWNGSYYALAMPGVFYRSRTGLGNFERGPRLFNRRMRHSALKLKGDVLWVFYTMVGDTPERILLSKIRLVPDWMMWQESEPIVVLEPKEMYEGVSLPLRRSRRGSAPGRVRRLRDPAIMQEAGKTYLLYSVAGESGIAIADLTLPKE